MFPENIWSYLSWINRPVKTCSSDIDLDDSPVNFSSGKREKEEEKSVRRGRLVICKRKNTEGWKIFLFSTRPVSGECTPVPLIMFFPSRSVWFSSLVFIQPRLRGISWAFATFIEKRFLCILLFFFLSSCSDRCGSIELNVIFGAKIITGNWILVCCGIKE